jgi:hypothetical protein
VKGIYDTRIGFELAFILCKCDARDQMSICSASAGRSLTKGQVRHKFVKSSSVSTSKSPRPLQALLAE